VVSIQHDGASASIEIDGMLATMISQQLGQFMNSQAVAISFPPTIDHNKKEKSATLVETESGSRMSWPPFLGNELSILNQHGTEVSNGLSDFDRFDRPADLRHAVCVHPECDLTVGIARIIERAAEFSIGNRNTDEVDVHSLGPGKEVILRMDFAEGVGIHRR